jgi:carbonic anhydrase
VGLADNWLRHVSDVRLRHRKRLDHLDPQAQEDALCDVNVIEQVGQRGHQHGDAGRLGARPERGRAWLVYGLSDGLLKDLGCPWRAPSPWSKRSATRSSAIPRRRAAGGSLT